MKRPKTINPHEDSSFHLIVKPIGPECNLGCDYCFYQEKKEFLHQEKSRIKPMSFDLLETLMKQFVSSRPDDAESSQGGGRELHMTWQGGEPSLCGVDYFREIVAIQKRIVPPGIRIINGFQTNGVLIDEEWARFFKDNNFLVGLSLDGPERFHDPFRKDKGGAGSFLKVMHSLDILKRYGVDFNTITCVSSHNAGSAREIYHFLKNAGSTFLQFIPIVEPVDDKETISSRTVSPAGWGRFLSDIFDLWVQKDIGRIFVNHFDSTLAGYLGITGGICVYNAHCGRALVAEHNGDIYSCDHFVNDEHRLGNITETSIARMAASDFQISFGRAKTDELPDTCHRCKYLPLCHGECPKNRIVSPPKGRGKLNWLCRGFKDFYAHTEPVFTAMAAALQKGYPASAYLRFVPPAPGRNAPCTCGSGKKYKQCHGKKSR